MPEPDCTRHEQEIARLRVEVGRRDDHFADLRQAFAVLEGRIPERLGDAISGMSGKIDGATRDIVEMKAMMRQDFVSRNEFDPIKKVVYGMVGLILTAVLTALVGLVVMK